MEDSFCFFKLENLEKVKNVDIFCSFLDCTLITKVSPHFDVKIIMSIRISNLTALLLMWESSIVNLLRISKMT